MRPTRIAVAFDHRGVVLRETVIGALEAAGLDVLDVGAASPSPRVDYPDKAREVADAMAAGSADRGVLVCGSGVGATIAANKVHGIRACLCHDTYSAHQGVEHDDMNVLCLGSEIVDTFVRASFDGAERHVARLRKVEELERDAGAAATGQGTPRDSQPGHG